MNWIKSFFSRWKGQPSVDKKAAAPNVTQRTSKKGDVTKLHPAEWVISQTDKQQLASGFVNHLLDNEKNEEQQANESEQFILAGVAQMIAEGVPESSIPRLPEVAALLLKDLDNPDINQNKILDQLKKDPALAADVLKLANSPLFRLSENKVDNLDRALLVLGLDNLKSIISSVLMKPMLDIKPIYFRMFGRELWQHSLDCAQACQNLCKQYGKGDPYSAYLVGLTHDIGKLVIFQLLIESFRQFNPDTSPRGAVLSNIFTAESPSLSLIIVNQWELSDYVATALNEQIVNGSSASKTDQSIYGLILNQANSLAEFKLLSSHRAENLEQFEEMLEQWKISRHIYDIAFPGEISQRYGVS